MSIPTEEVYRWLERLPDHGVRLSLSVRLQAERLIGARPTWPKAEAVTALASLVATSPTEVDAISDALYRAAKPPLDEPRPAVQEPIRESEWVSPPANDEPLRAEEVLPPEPVRQAARASVVGPLGAAVTVIALVLVVSVGAPHPTLEPLSADTWIGPDWLESCPPPDVARLCERRDMVSPGSYVVYAGDTSKLPPTDTHRVPLALGLGALGLVLGLTAWARWRGFIPDPVPPPTRGPLTVPPTPDEPWPDLLDTQEREELGWGAGWVLGEEATRTLDVAGTVRATLRRAGLPTMVFRPRTHERSLWLLVDRDDDSLLGPTFVDQLARELASIGVPSRRLMFDARLGVATCTESGERLEFDELDDGGRSRVLIVVSPATGLVYDGALTPRAERALRPLRAASHAVWVDPSRSATTRRALEPILPVLSPEQLPGWVAKRVVGEQVRPSPLALRRWASACVRYRTLPPPRARTAWHLAEALELPVRALHLPTLWALGSTSSGPLQLAAEVADKARVGASAEDRSRAGRWWRAHLEEARRRLRDEPESAGSPADQSLDAREDLLTLEDADPIASDGCAPETVRRAAGRLYRRRAFHGITHHALSQALISHEAREAMPPDARAKLWAVEEGRRLTPAPASDRLRRARALALGVGLVSCGFAVDALTRPPPPVPPELVGVEFVRVPGGVGCVGSPVCEAGRDTDEGLLRVELRDFAIAKTETTLAALRASRGEATTASDPIMPAVKVDWEEARAFCQSLGPGFDLPTEAQWEYALRAGTVTAYPFGNDAEPLEDYAWFSKNSGIKVHPVATKKPNRLGIHDLMGNALEWVRDEYESRKEAALDTPRLEPCLGCDRPVGANRVIRGGAFNDDAWWLRSVSRYRNQPGIRLRYLGFRCVGPSLPSSKLEP